MSQTETIPLLTPTRGTSHIKHVHGRKRFPTGSPFIVDDRRVINRRRSQLEADIIRLKQQLHALQRELDAKEIVSTEELLETKALIFSKSSEKHNQNFNHLINDLMYITKEKYSMIGEKDQLEQMIQIEKEFRERKISELDQENNLNLNHVFPKIPEWKNIEPVVPIDTLTDRANSLRKQLSIPSSSLPKEQDTAYQIAHSFEYQTRLLSLPKSSLQEINSSLQQLVISTDAQIHHLQTDISDLESQLRTLSIHWPTIEADAKLSSALKLYDQEIIHLDSQASDLIERIDASNVVINQLSLTSFSDIEEDQPDFSFSDDDSEEEEAGPFEKFLISRKHELEKDVEDLKEMYNRNKFNAKRREESLKSEIQELFTRHMKYKKLIADYCATEDMVQSAMIQEHMTHMFNRIDRRLKSIDN